MNYTCEMKKSIEEIELEIDLKMKKKKVKDWVGIGSMYLILVGILFADIYVSSGQ